jgi:hypothetical protein
LHEGGHFDQHCLFAKVDMSFATASVEFLRDVSSVDREDQLCDFAKAASSGIIPPFTECLLGALGLVESASPGYAADNLKRLAPLKGA